MAIVNGNYAKLQDSYLFTDIAKRVAAFTAAHPEKKIIKMGIGDVTLPLAPCVVDAMKKAVEELGHKETFRGYGPEQGYEFLHEAIQKYYARHGVKLDTKDIFISDGAKSDCGNITDLFEDTNVVLVPNPVYPVYADTNVMRGRKILYMNGTPQNHFLPMPDDSVKADIIYLCSPNNPTGAVYTREQLEKWVAYARKNDAIILYDAAYEAFITDPSIPVASLPFPVPVNVPLSFALSPRRLVSPEPGVAIRLCLRNWFAGHLMGKNSTSIRCGSAVRRQNSMGSTILCSAALKPPCPS